MSKKEQSATLNSEKTKDIRMTNIIAARGKANGNCVAVADVVRTSLGPRGMDKMVSPECSTHLDPRHQRKSFDHQ